MSASPSLRIDLPLACASALSVALLGSAALVLRRPQPRITAARRAPAPGIPFVSVVVPDHGDAEAITPCLQALLAQRYPAFEVIAVGMHEQDPARALLARMAERDPRLSLLPGQPPPEGWLSKPWACWRGAQAARGEWLLFTAADTCLAPQALAAAIDCARELEVDLLSLRPRHELRSFWERALLPGVLGLVWAIASSPAEVNDPQRPAAIATGKFLLFRRTAYEAIGGHAAVRAEPLEDLALARALKASGRTLLLASGRDLLVTRMFTSPAQLWESCSRDAYAIASQRPLRWTVGALAATGLVLGPCVLGGWGLARLAWGHRDPTTRLVLGQASFQLAVLAGYGAAINRAMRSPAPYGLLFPAGALFAQAALVRSIWQARRRWGRGVPAPGNLAGSPDGLLALVGRAGTGPIASGDATNGEVTNLSEPQRAE